MWSVFEHGGKAIDEVFEKYGLTERKEIALQIYRLQQPDISFYEGVEGMLARIQKSRKVGIITDGRPEGQRAKIDALGLKADRIIITDELGGIGYHKPNPTAFQMMQRFFDVPFHRMMYVGDNQQKDFAAPDQPGMKSVWFRNPDEIYTKRVGE